MKIIKIFLGISLVLVLLVGITAELFFQAKLQRFIVNVDKYLAMNLHQNWGWRLNTLKTIDTVATLYPRTDLWSDALIERYRARLLNERKKGEYQPTHIVSNVNELYDAVKKASPGTIIELYPASFELTSSILLMNDGLYDMPIILTGSRFGESKIVSSRQVAIKIFGSNWILQNLTINGTCEYDYDCEHAIQIKGNADNTQILNNNFVNFNSHIKSGGYQGKKDRRREYPDNVRIISNSFVNEWPRDTKNPVTSIDVVGGDHWLVDQNFIADFEKLRGNGISYGAFLKGGGKYGVISNNVVACAWKLPYSTNRHVRIPLSFGGGGSGKQFCADQQCEREHRDGLLVGNFVVNCPTDVAIYINNSERIKITENRLINSLGIDVDKHSAEVSIYNNALQGDIRWRNESTGISYQNEFISRNTTNP